MLFSIIFLVVETAIAIVFHSFFAKQVDKITEWFKRYRRFSFSVILPLLLLTNFGMTFFFSAGGSPTTQEHSPLTPSEGPQAERTEELPVLRSRPESPSQPPDSAASPRDSSDAAPIKGDPADNTLE
jgi:hypothetical protein